MNEHSSSPTEFLRWFEQHTLPFESCDLAEPLGKSEKSFLGRLTQDAEVIGLGEMTHGASEIVRGRYRLLRNLIEEHNVTVIVMETEMSRTQILNDCVLTGKENPEDALAATGSFLVANQETLEFIEWLNEFNASQGDDQKRVHVVGCDMQSLDGLQAMLTRLLNAKAHEMQSWSTQTADILARLSELPTDDQLGSRIGLYFEELSCDSPSTDRVAELLRSQAELVDSVVPIVDDITASINKIGFQQETCLSREECFYLDRCARMMHQCLEHYRFDQGSAPRDRSMAEYVLAIREHFSGQRLALLAGNLHVSRSPMQFEGYGQYSTTGSLIASKLGEKYCAIGSAFYSGRYLGVAGNTAVEAIVVESHLPREGTFELLLHSFAVATETPNFLLDLQTQRSSGVVFPWPENLLMHLGEAAPKQSYEATFVRQSPHRQYDALQFVTTTTPTNILDGYYRFWKS